MKKVLFVLLIWSFASYSMQRSLFPCAQEYVDDESGNDEFRDLVFFLGRTMRQAAAIAWHVIQDDCNHDDDDEYTECTLEFVARHIGGGGE